MTRRFRGPVLAVLCLLGAWLPSPAWGAWAEHLDIIGYDQVQADGRFNTLSGASLGIAVLDTGVDEEHFSFVSRNVTGSNFNTSNLAPKAPPNYQDGNGHGTQVGSIAAGNHGTITSLDIQLGGIAHGADVVAVRVLDNAGNGSFTQIIAGMDWVIDQIENHGSNIRVVNMSLGTTDTFITAPVGQVVDDFNDRAGQLLDLGVSIVAASGNSGSQTGLSFPAVLDAVIAVGSTANDDTISSFTNRNDLLDLLAPGENVWGADAAIAPGGSNFIVTDAYSGTSLAAPQVSGAILLILELAEQRWGRSATPEEVFDILTSTGVQIVEGENTYRRLDLYAALEHTYAIPEPGALLLLSGGSVILLLRRRAVKG